jgi:hypothetical protein
MAKSRRAGIPPVPAACARACQAKHFPGLHLSSRRLSLCQTITFTASGLSRQILRSGVGVARPLRFPSASHA